jgi:hypothetical protein
MDLSTELWMGGILTFGIVFYFISMYYAQHSEDDE